MLESFSSAPLETSGKPCSDLASAFSEIDPSKLIPLRALSRNFHDFQNGDKLILNSNGDEVNPIGLKIKHVPPNQNPVLVSTPLLRVTDCDAANTVDQSASDTSSCTQVVIQSARNAAPCNKAVKGS